jgi:hypothetical protein
VVKSKLFDSCFSNSIDATVAHVSDHSAAFGQTENTARGSHSLELTVLSPSTVDGFVSTDDRFTQAIFNGRRVAFEVGVWQCVDGDAAGKIAHGMSPHAIRHNEQIPTATPFGVVCGHPYLKRVLIHGASHPFVGA